MKKKIYCNQCYYYQYSRMLSHFCDHPKWLIDKKAIRPGTAIHPPSTYKLWHDNHKKPMELNKNNDCPLFKKGRSWILAILRY